jgi:phosphohistidine phosphatase SixA|tara:strand:- start:442 stop:987 length:546 start_codon:yes stop_codon:yes gene_type:complete
MKKYLILLFLSFFCSVTYANTKVISALEEGGKLIFIRHAYAPGGGDPKNFDITRCSSQRNLDATGIKQSKRIGKFFRDNKISIDLVFSSEWCRCKDTAKNAFKNYKTFKALNSFFSSKFAKNREEQMKELKAFVKNWNSKKNMVFVTHYVVISEALGVNVKSGMIVVADKKFKIIGTIETN